MITYVSAFSKFLWRKFSSRYSCVINRVAIFFNPSKFFLNAARWPHGAKIENAPLNNYLRFFLTTSVVRKRFKEMSSAYLFGRRKKYDVRSFCFVLLFFAKNHFRFLSVCLLMMIIIIMQNLPLEKLEEVQASSLKRRADMRVC